MKNYLLCFFISLAYLNSAKGQGCSDAGFCTMGAMKPDQRFDKKLDVKLRSIEISQYVGVDKFKDVIMATTLDFNVGIGKRNTFQFKLPYMNVLTYLANSQGLGDVSLSFSRNLIAKEGFQLNATVGAKIPTGNSNIKSSEGIPLSMYHQSSLGTYDIIAGFSVINKQWLFAAGYQQPLNENGNEFLQTLWADNPLFSNRALKYPNSKNLRRKADYMLRVERNFRFARFNFHIGFLNIHRFNEDEVTTPQGIRVKVKNSNGSALSLLLGMAYQLTAKSSIKAIFGDSWFQRERNPDGLSRQQVYTMAYQWSF